MKEAKKIKIINLTKMLIICDRRTIKSVKDIRLKVELSTEGRVEMAYNNPSNKKIYIKNELISLRTIHVL